MSLVERLGRRPEDESRARRPANDLSTQQHPSGTGRVKPITGFEYEKSVCVVSQTDFFVLLQTVTDRYGL